MNRAAIFIWLALGAGCEPHGVSLGSEAPCIADSRLTSSELQGEAARLSPCAVVQANVLVNAGFESPAVGDCQNGLFCQFPATQVGWQTTSGGGVIEVWNDGHRGVPAPQGAQFVELDAHSRDTVWQDVMLSPGQLVYWSLLHRGREGLESLELALGPPDAPASQAVLESDADDWYRYSGLYRVGEAEPVTRLALVSRSGVTEGNLVDAVLLAPVDEP